MTESTETPREDIPEDDRCEECGGRIGSNAEDCDTCGIEADEYYAQRYDYERMVGRTA